jgi:hypothetical protein
VGEGEDGHRGAPAVRAPAGGARRLPPRRHARRPAPAHRRADRRQAPAHGRAGGSAVGRRGARPLHGKRPAPSSSSLSRGHIHTVSLCEVGLPRTFSNFGFKWLVLLGFGKFLYVFLLQTFLGSTWNWISGTDGFIVM